MSFERSRIKEAGVRGWGGRGAPFWSLVVKSNPGTGRGRGAWGQFKGCERDKKEPGRGEQPARHHGHSVSNATRCPAGGAGAISSVLVRFEATRTRKLALELDRGHWLWLVVQAAATTQNYHRASQPLHVSRRLMDKSRRFRLPATQCHWLVIVPVLIVKGGATPTLPERPRLAVLCEVWVPQCVLGSDPPRGFVLQHAFQQVNPSLAALGVLWLRMHIHWAESYPAARHSGGSMAES